MSTDLGYTTQSPCPAELHKRHDGGRESAPPGPGLGTCTGDMAVGEFAYIFDWGVYYDGHEKLWVEGKVIAQSFPGDGREVFVERVEAGLRVHSWPDGKRIKSRDWPYPTDIWVVDFPTPPDPDA